MTPSSVDQPLWRQLEIARLRHLNSPANAPEVYAAMIEAIADSIETYAAASDRPLTAASLDAWLRQEATRAARFR